jgi:hypothetical protein
MTDLSSGPCKVITLRLNPEVKATGPLIGLQRWRCRDRRTPEASTLRSYDAQACPQVVGVRLQQCTKVTQEISDVQGRPWTIADTHHHSRAITAERPGRSRSASFGTGPGSFDWAPRRSVCQAVFTARVVPAPTDGLDGELAQLRDRRTGRMALLQRYARALVLTCVGAV